MHCLGFSDSTGVASLFTDACRQGERMPLHGAASLQHARYASPAEWCDANNIEPVPSVLSGLVVRFYASKAYHMSRVLGMQLDPSGKVEVQLQVGAGLASS